MPKSDFSRQTGIMLAGNIAAQAVPLLVLPLITRLYLPADLGVYAVYAAIASIVGAVACAKLELAIVVAPDDDESRVVARIAIGITALAGLATFLLTWALAGALEGFLAVQFPFSVIVLIALAVVFSGLIQVLTMLMNRTRRYSAMAGVRVVQVVMTAAVQVAFGWFLSAEHRGIGLVAAGVAGQAVALLFLASRGRSGLRDEGGIKAVIGSAPAIVRKYRNFIVFNTPYSFLAALSRSIPVYILAMFGSAANVGYFSLARSAAYVPQSFLSSSLGPVYFERAARLRGSAELEAITHKTMLAVAMMFTPGFVYVGYWAIEIFTVAFGAAWVEAGSYFAILVVPALLVLFASWQDRLYEVHQRQKLALALQASSDVLITAGLWAVLYTGASVRTGILALALMLSAYYVVWTVVTYRMAGFSMRGLPEVVKLLGLSGGVVLGGCIAANALLVDAIPRLAFSLIPVGACYAVALKRYSRFLRP